MMGKAVIWQDFSEKALPYQMSMFMSGGFPGMAGSSTPKFELIENAKQVCNQLREQQKS
jgi:hypothetical protein